MLGIIILCTPYVYYSTLEINMVSISSHLTEILCINALPLLTSIDFILAVTAGFNLCNKGSTDSNIGW